MHPIGAERSEPEIEFHALAVNGKTVEFAVDLRTFDSSLVDSVSQQIANGELPNQALIQLMLDLVPPEGTMLDLGAHVGTFSLAAASAGRRVVSIEASPLNAELLRASAARNGFGRMHVVEAAVGDCERTVEFVVAGPGGHIANSDWRGPATAVRMAPVERLLAEVECEKIGFVKMDVEGSEVAALRGMRRLLSGPDAPPIVFESNAFSLDFFGESPRTLKLALEDLGYRSYLVGAGCLIPVAAADFQAGTVLDYLAAKSLPACLPGWTVRGALSRDELLAQTLNECRQPVAECRAAIARSLQAAPNWLLGSREVRLALAALADDADPFVRNAARWSKSVGFRLQAAALNAAAVLRRKFRRAA